MLDKLIGQTRSAPSDSVVVIGLGRFGASVAQALSRMGHDVLGVDTDTDAVARLAQELAHVVEADASDIAALKQLGVGDCQRAVVSIGENLEASVLAVLNLSQIGVKDIWAKANNPAHGRILERIGAHHVVYPEADMGERVAHLVTGKMIDFIEFDDGFAIAKTRAPRETLSKSLTDSNVRQRHGVTVVGIKRQHLDFIYAKADTVVKPGDLLIVAGPTQAIERFAARV